MVKSDGGQRRVGRRATLRSGLSAGALLGLAALQSPSVPAREGRIPAEARPAGVTLREGADPRIHFQAGAALPAALGEKAESLLEDSAVPLTLASADFDGDGVPDLVAGYRIGGAGAMVFWRGNEDSIHPNAPAAAERREKGEISDSPFFASRVTLVTAEAPDWLFAGDFDGDGHPDLVFAARGSAAIHILPGNGAGGFLEPRRRDLPGAITAMAGGTLDSRSGGLGIAVAVLGRRGASLLILDSGSSASFEAVSLPAPAAALAIARLDDGLQSGVVAAAGSEAVAVRRGSFGPDGRVRVERRSLPFLPAAMTAGNFGPGSREGLALLAEDGRSYLLLPGEVPAPEKAEEAVRVRAASRREAKVVSPAPYLFSGSPAAMPAAALRVADLKDWSLTETAGEAAPGGEAIRAVRLSGSEADDLVVLDGHGKQIDIISAPAPDDAASASGARSLAAQPFSRAAALDVAGEPVAVLPMRLNEDGLSDLVVLRSGSITPAVVLSASALSLTVNSNGDTGDASPGNGICADSNGNCTLRAAIQEANASAGADTINFNISGAGVHTITTGSSLPPITGTVTINGTTQSGYAGLPLIEVKGSTGQIGLQIQVSDCVVRGLAINGYEASGQTGGVGIYIVSSGPLVKNALLEANFIGTDPAGTTAKPNHLGIDFENTSLHTVGGTTAAARNLISGNSLVGIQVIGPAASGNTFQGNYVGTTADGSAALPNAFAGFNLFANNTVVGGAAAGAGNVISGNGGGGLFTSQFCAPSCFGSGTVVKANRIGTNPAGDSAVGNTRGVLTSSPGSPNTTIANNLISGNPNGGIQIDESLATVTNITGNFIGTDVTGTLALGNGNNGGILIHTTVATAQINVGGATGTTAGGSCTGSCNLISANSQYGIYAFGSGPVSIVYNYIGTDVTGTQALGNDSAGVVLAAAGKTLGASAASGNLISANGNEFFGGVGVVSQSAGSPGNTIKGNLIGTTASGSGALPNLGDGVTLGASDTLGSVSDPNTISGNLGNGVVIPNTASFTSVLGNRIGVKTNGAALGNGFDGVASAASDVTIQANQIAYNAGRGVTVTGSAVRDSIRGNTIHHNTGLGIDLGGDGVTPNDLGDADTGPNNLQNFPDGIIASWDQTSNQTTIRGQIDTTNPNLASVDVFANSIPDPSAHGQGEVLLGSATPDANGSWCLTIAGLPAFAAPPAGSGTLAQPPFLSATATDAAGNTSEFSDATLPPVLLAALEVNQAVQNWTNSVPIIKDKATYVRAHLHTTDPNGLRVIVQVRLRGFRGGVELAGSPITPFNFGPIVVKPAVATHRSYINNSANFRLPDAWLNGTVALRLERTDGPLACAKPADANLPPGQCDSCVTTVTFEEGSTFPLKVNLVQWKDYKGDVHIWDDAEIDEMVRRLVAIYPIAKLTDVQRGVIQYEGPTPPDLGDLSNSNRAMAKQRGADGCFGSVACPRLYLGILKDMGGGLANNIPGIMASVGISADPLVNARNDHTHELGHVLGRAHDTDKSQFGVVHGYASGPCHDYADDPPLSGVFPYFFFQGGRWVSTLGPMQSGENAKMFGMDSSFVPGPNVVDPTVHLELMGYCGIAQHTYDWNSDYSYKGFHATITSRFPPTGPSPSPPGRKPSPAGATTAQDYLLIDGEIDLDLDTGVLRPISRVSVSGIPEAPPSGAYTLQTRDGSGNVLGSIPFAPLQGVPEFSPAPTGPAQFLIPVAADPAIRQVRVLKGAVLIVSRSASTNSPSVTVTYPNGGETLSQDPVVLQWSASDADGDPLTYLVQYSPDGGSSWQALAVDWPDKTLSVPNRLLAGTTNGLIRVTASDGFNTAADQTNSVFTVPNHAPRVTILSPTQNQAFAGSQQMVFEGLSWDVENGLLAGSSIQWSSNIDGALGSGTNLLKTASQLSPGNHTITATATDSSSLSGFASVNISVATTAPATFADLSIAQDAAPDPGTTGSPVSFVITVINAGRDGATGVQLTDTLPAGATLVSAVASQGSCSPSGGTVTCGLGALAADATATVTVTVTPSATGTITNTASVIANEPDPVPVNNSFFRDARINSAAPSVPRPANQSVCAGATAVFTVTASGSGPLTYHWRRNGVDVLEAGRFSGTGTATLTITSSATTDSGGFEVRVTDIFGQTVSSGLATLTVSQAPSAAIAATAAVCANRGGNHASVPSAGPGATYSWSIGNGTITSGAGTSSIVYTSGPSGSVSLNVTVTGACGPAASSGIGVPISACAAQPQNLAVDPVPDGILSNGNGILEPGETAIVKPFWKNPGGASLPLTGTATGLAGPAGAVYNLKDAVANYGTIAAGATNDCATATGNCYEIGVTDPVIRPSAHWDATLTETLSDGDPEWVWPIHIGKSFTDVPTGHVFYQFVERILHNGVTTGCTPATYCPDTNVFRLQMAVFIARAQAGGDGNIPVSGSAQGNPYNCVSGGQSQFTDIAPDNPFCRHVHYIFSTGVTTGCVSTPPRQYCPNDNVTRGQMALFIARAVAGSDAAVPQTYGPDPVTGRSYSCNAGTPNLHFTDIATSDIFCRHTHYLWARDVISGFPDGSYGPALPVIRGAMAKFLANGFGLTLK